MKNFTVKVGFVVGYDTTRFAPPRLEDSSLQILSRSVRMEGDGQWTVSFIGFKSRFWLDHSSTFTELSLSYSSVVRIVVMLEG